MKPQGRAGVGTATPPSRSTACWKGCTSSCATAEGPGPARAATRDPGGTRGPTGACPCRTDLRVGACPLGVCLRRVPELGGSSGSTRTSPRRRKPGWRPGWPTHCTLIPWPIRWRTPRFSGSTTPRRSRRFTKARGAATATAAAAAARASGKARGTGTRVEAKTGRGGRCTEWFVWDTARRARDVRGESLIHFYWNAGRRRKGRCVRETHTHDQPRRARHAARGME
mmetsp:Transcript_10222/g.37865  ORF Transcript_10222/g.37865 Transcript_10222/m.37865 type:complete len:226 (+) Transcript_10222:659-1336(+)